jgi:DNA modification methylase
MLKEIHKTKFGTIYCGDSLLALKKNKLSQYINKINLIFTSPPFPLVKEKEYGNLKGQEYINWIVEFGHHWKKLLTDDGSLIIEIGNAWEDKLPCMSTVTMEALIALKQECGFYLCQEFIVHNPSRLPSPVKWVNTDRIRLKDSYTRVWWLSKSPYPKADNRKILKKYSLGMERLLKTGKFNAGNRPSGFNISETGFLKNNGGSISSSVISEFDDDYLLESAMSISNTNIEKNYRTFCKDNNLPIHPARMNGKIVDVFLEFLTDQGDLVFDPFGGSCITGHRSEELNRRWITVELDQRYAEGSVGRFNVKEK